jgi:hypothetical protein
MDGTQMHQRLETLVRSTDGSEYTVTVRSRSRDDGRWEAILEFSPVGPGGRLVTTPVQTTQSSARQILYWAGGLSRTHLEDSLDSALHRAPQPRAEATPASAIERRQHLHPIEEDVLAMFRAARATRLPTRAVFTRGPHSNADFVRAFEDLEKQWRYLVRRTIDGVDWLDLTVEGARAAGVPALAADGPEMVTPPRSAG